MAKNLNPWERIYQAYSEGRDLPKGLAPGVERQMVVSLTRKQSAFLEEGASLRETILDDSEVLSKDPHDRAVAYPEAEHIFWINDVSLELLPENIAWSDESHHLSYSTVRTRTSTKIPAGRSVKHLRLTIPFQGLEDINGKLRRLLCQAYTFPFFLVENQLVRQVTKPESPTEPLLFAVTDFSVQTNPELKDTLIASIGLEVTAHETYTSYLRYVSAVPAPPLATSQTTPKPQDAVVGPQPLPDFSNGLTPFVLAPVKWPEQSNLFVAYYDALLAWGNSDAYRTFIERRNQLQLGGLWGVGPAVAQTDTSLKKALEEAKKAVEDQVLDQTLMRGLIDADNVRLMRSLDTFDGRFKLSYYKYMFVPSEALASMREAIKGGEAATAKTFSEFDLGETARFFGLDPSGMFFSTPPAASAQAEESAGPSSAPAAGPSNYTPANQPPPIVQQLPPTRKTNGDLVKFTERVQGKYQLNYGKGREGDPDRGFFDCTLFVWHCLRKVGLFNVGSSRMTQRLRLLEADGLVRRGGVNANDLAPRLRVTDYTKGGGSFLDVPIPLVALTPAVRTGEYDARRNTATATFASLIPGLILMSYGKDKAPGSIKFHHAALSVRRVGTTKIDESLSAFSQSSIGNPRTREAINQKEGVGFRSPKLWSNPLKLSSLLQPLGSGRAYDEAYFVPGLVYDARDEGQFKVFNVLFNTLGGDMKTWWENTLRLCGHSKRFLPKEVKDTPAPTPPTPLTTNDVSEEEWLRRQGIAPQTPENDQASDLQRMLGLAPKETPATTVDAVADQQTSARAAIASVIGDPEKLIAKLQAQAKAQKNNLVDGLSKTSAAARESYKLFVRKVEEYRRKLAGLTQPGESPWEMIWTNDGNLLFRKKVTLDLSEGVVHTTLGSGVEGNGKSEPGPQSSEAVPTFLSAGLALRWGRLPLLGNRHFSHQYMGGGETQATAQFAITGNYLIAKLATARAYVQEAARKFRRIPDAGVFEVENGVLNLFGIRHVLVEDVPGNTIASSPGTYQLTLRMVEYDIQQRKREEIVSEGHVRLDLKKKYIEALVGGLLKKIGFPSKLQRRSYSDGLRYQVSYQFKKSWNFADEGADAGNISLVEAWRHVQTTSSTGAMTLDRRELIELLILSVFVAYLEALPPAVLAMTGASPAVLANYALAFQESTDSEYKNKNNFLYSYGLFSHKGVNERFLDLMEIFATGIIASRAVSYEERQKRAVDGFLAQFGSPYVKRPSLDGIIPRQWWNLFNAQILEGWSSWASSFGESIPNIVYKYFYGLGTENYTEPLPNELRDGLVNDLSRATKEVRENLLVLLKDTKTPIDQITAGQNAVTGEAERRLKAATALASWFHFLREDLNRVAALAMKVLRTDPDLNKILTLGEGLDGRLGSAPESSQSCYPDIPLPKFTIEVPLSSGKTTLVRYANPGFFWYNEEATPQERERRLSGNVIRAIEDGYAPTAAFVNSFGPLPTEINKNTLELKREGNEVLEAYAPVGPYAAAGATGPAGGPNGAAGAYTQGNQLPDALKLVGLDYPMSGQVARGGHSTGGMPLGVPVGGTPSRITAEATTAQEGSSLQPKRAAAPDTSAPERHPFKLDKVYFGPEGTVEYRVPITLQRDPAALLKHHISGAAGAFRPRSMKDAFPTFKLYFVEDDVSQGLEDGHILYRQRSYSDFFSYNSIIDIKFERDQKVPADLLVLTLSNVHGNLDNVEFQASNYSKDDVLRPNDTDANVRQTSIANADTEFENPFKRLILKEGVRVRFLGGSGANVNALDDEFNGQIVEMNFDNADQVVIVCQSFATQLVAERKGVGGASMPPSQWADTFELLSYLVCQPEMTHFGRWDLDPVRTLAESRSSGGLEKMFSFLAKANDDNIFAPGRGEMIALSADIGNGLFATFMRSGGKPLSSVYEALNSATTTLRNPNRTGQGVNITVKKVYVSGNAAVYKVDYPSLPVSSEDGRIAQAAGLMVLNKDEKTSTGFSAILPTYGRGESTLLDYTLQNTTIWDVLKEMELRHPGWIGTTVPYGERMTVFFGTPSQLYWSRPMTAIESAEAQARQAQSLGSVQKTLGALNKELQLQNAESIFGTDTGNQARATMLRYAHKALWLLMTAGTIALAVKTAGTSLAVTGGLTSLTASAASAAGWRWLLYGAASRGAGLLSGVASKFGAKTLIGIGTGTLLSGGISVGLNRSLASDFSKSWIRSLFLSGLASEEIRQAIRTRRLRPFRRTHFITSEKHIIGNTLKCSSHNIYNAMAIEHRDENDSKWRSTVLKASMDILDKDVRMGFAPQYPNCRGEWMARRYAVGLLLRSLKDMYRGEIVVLGDLSIRPHDIVFIADSYTGLYGRFEVGGVTHLMNADTGFITVIRPSLCVTANALLDVPFDDYESELHLWESMTEGSVLSNMLALERLYEKAPAKLLDIQRRRSQELATNNIPSAGSALNSGEGVQQFLSNSTVTVTGGGLAVAAIAGAPLLGAAALVGGTALAISSSLWRTYRNYRKNVAHKAYAFSSSRQPIIAHPLVLNGRPLLSGLPIERISFVQRIRENFVPMVFNMAKGFEVTQLSYENTNLMAAMNYILNTSK